MGKHSKPLDVAGKETPLMKQYNRIKVKHPDTVLLFRVGDFYETFGADAVAAAKVLNIPCCCTVTITNVNGYTLRLGTWVRRRRVAGKCWRTTATARPSPSAERSSSRSTGT